MRAGTSAAPPAENGMIKRTGRDRFVRNVLIAAGNGGDAAHGEAVAALLDDASPLVRGAAIWALARIDLARLTAERVRASGEEDANIKAEWAHAFPPENVS